MAYSTKVRKIGNSLGIILPKEALAELKVEEGQALYLSRTPDGGLRVTAGDEDFEKTMEVGRSLMKRYRNALQELAK